MTVSSESGDDHRAVKKNGVDHIQDRELATLRNRLEKNDADHSAIMLVLGEIQNDRKWFKWAAGFIVAILLAGATFFGWVAVSIAESNAAHSATVQRDKGIQDDIQDVEQDLRDLRRLVNEHQRNKDEHIQRKSSD